MTGLRARFDAELARALACDDPVEQERLLRKAERLLGRQPTSPALRAAQRLSDAGNALALSAFVASHNRKVAKRARRAWRRPTLRRRSRNVVRRVQRRAAPRASRDGPSEDPEGPLRRAPWRNWAPAEDAHVRRAGRFQGAS
jgi:hypothetical protein